MRLRSYQSAAVNAVLAEYDKGTQRTMIVMPTGSGKTVVLGHVAKAMMGRGRIMVIAHRDELIRQAADKIGRITGIKPSIEKADEKSEEWNLRGEKPPIVVGSVQSLNSQRKGVRRCQKFPPSEFALLIIDEVHHATADSYVNVLGWFATDNPHLNVLGVTATADRADGTLLGTVFQSVAYDYELNDIIRDGYLVPIRQASVRVEGLDFSKIRTTAGDLNQGDLEAVMLMEKPLHGIAHATLELSLGISQGALKPYLDDPNRAAILRSLIGTRKPKQTLLFCVSVAQAERMAEIINRWMPQSAAHVHGAMTPDLRKNTLANFKAGITPYMAACMLPTEGYDNENIEMIVMGRPTKSRPLFAQMAGRGTRPLECIAAKLGELETPEERRALIASSNKPNMLILDFVGNCGRHKLVSMVDIMGEGTPDNVLELAKQKMLEAPGLDVADCIGESRDEIETKKREALERKKERERLALEESQRSAATRMQLVGTSRYTFREVDALDPDAKKVEWQSRFPLIPGKQLEVFKRAKVPTEDIARLTPYDAKRLSQRIIYRYRAGLCTYKQGKVLLRAGWSREEIEPMTFDYASLAIDAAAQNHWKRPPGWTAEGAA